MPVDLRSLMFLFISSILILPVAAAGNVVFSPSVTEVTLNAGGSANFSVSSANSSDISWILDGVTVDQDLSSGYSSYVFSHNEAASYNLEVIVDEGNHDLSRKWQVEVIPAFNITFSPDDMYVPSRLDRAPTFRANVSEVSGITWYVDDEIKDVHNDVDHSVYEPQMSEAGNYSIKVHVTNPNGTARRQWYWSATPTPSQIMSGGNGGGSASSGMVVSGEDQRNIRIKDVNMQIVNKDTVTKYSFLNEGNPIEYLEFRSSVNAGYVKFVTEVLNNRSMSVPSDPDDIAYCYVNLVPSDKVLENRIRATCIMFRVEREWIDENDIDLDSVRLNLFDDSTWKPFPTKVMKGTDNDIFLVSTATGFGHFAVTGKSIEDPGEDIVVVDMGGSSGSDHPVNGFNGDGVYKNMTADEEDILSSVLRSMTELFKKRNPLGV